LPNRKSDGILTRSGHGWGFERTHVGYALASAIVPLSPAYAISEAARRRTRRQHVVPPGTTVPRPLHQTGVRRCRHRPDSEQFDYSAGAGADSQRAHHLNSADLCSGPGQPACSVPRRTVGRSGSSPRSAARRSDCSRRSCSRSSSWAGSASGGRLREIQPLSMSWPTLDASRKRVVCDAA
jgi:hypothetical protein